MEVPLPNLLYLVIMLENLREIKIIFFPSQQYITTHFLSVIVAIHKFTLPFEVAIHNLTSENCH